VHFLRRTQGVLTMSMSAGAATGSVTASVRGEDGVVVVSGTATHVGTGGDYSIKCPPQTELNRLTTTWTGTWSGVSQSVETYDEVVGGHLFSIAEARAFKDGLLADANAYPDTMIRQARERIADDFQNCCGVPFFPRYERETLYGVGRTTLWLPYKRPLRLVSVSVSGATLSTPDLAAVTAYPTGRLLRTAAWPNAAPVVVRWERGFNRVPEEIKRAALALCHYELTASDITDRQVTFANELGTVRLSMPGRQNPTGIPLVDAVLYRFDERDVLVAVR
jgi:hypothetical protein